MKTSSAKQKGRKLQQLVRERILESFPVLQDGDVKSTSMGAQGEDVQLSPYARTVLPISVEAKARRSIAVGRWYEQAQEHAIGTALNPVVVMKEDRKDPLVLISLSFFMAMMKDRYDHYKDWLKQEQEISKKAKETK